MNNKKIFTSMAAALMSAAAILVNIFLLFIFLNDVFKS